MDFFLHIISISNFQLENSWMVNITSTPVGHNSTNGKGPASQLVELLFQMIENPPAIAPELQQLMNFSRLAPLLDGFLNLQVESQ